MFYVNTQGFVLSYLKIALECYRFVFLFSFLRNLTFSYLWLTQRNVFICVTVALPPVLHHASVGDWNDCGFSLILHLQYVNGCISFFYKCHNIILRQYLLHSNLEKVPETTVAVKWLTMLSQWYFALTFLHPAAGWIFKCWGGFFVKRRSLLKVLIRQCF